MDAEFGSEWVEDWEITIDFSEDIWRYLDPVNRPSMEDHEIPIDVYKF